MVPMNWTTLVLDSEHLSPFKFKKTKIIGVYDTKTVEGLLSREGDLGRKRSGTSTSTVRRMDPLFRLPIPHILESGA